MRIAPAGRKGTLASVDLDAIMKPLHDSLQLVEVYCREGWLLHIACNDHIKADFDQQHNVIVESLEVRAAQVWPEMPSGVMGFGVPLQVFAFPN